jgi:uncharacterized protein YuzE
MKVELDASTDMAYIRLTDEAIAPPLETEALVIRLDSGVVRLVNLDFSADGRLVGLEVEAASRSLPRDVLSAAVVAHGEGRRLLDLDV